MSVFVRLSLPALARRRFSSAHADQHASNIVDQFSKQAVPFSSAPAIADPHAIRQIISACNASASDTVLDVACGGGVVATEFALHVKHITGVDITASMLEHAQKLTAQKKLTNCTWHHNDVLKFMQTIPAASYSVVYSRLAFHHMIDPYRVLLEMKRVCKPGGRVMVVDTETSADPFKAALFNHLELLRDPSHIRAMPIAELKDMFTRADLKLVHHDHYLLKSDVESLLARSFPLPGNADKVRQLFAQSQQDDCLGIPIEPHTTPIKYAYKIAVLVAQR